MGEMLFTVILLLTGILAGFSITLAVMLDRSQREVLSIRSRLRELENASRNQRI